MLRDHLESHRRISRRSTPRALDMAWTYAGCRNVQEKPHELASMDAVVAASERSEELSPLNIMREYTRLQWDDRLGMTYDTLSPFP